MAMNKPQIFRELVISGDSVPIIIGTNGNTIKKLQEIYGVKMRFLGENDVTYAERTLRITARDVISADNALQKVEELLRSGPVWTEPVEKLPQARQSSVNPSYFTVKPSEQHVEDKYMLAYPLYEQVAGRNDANLKAIKSSLSLTALELGGLCSDESGQQFRPIILRGSVDKVEEAKQMLQRMVDSFYSKQKDVLINNNYGDNLGLPFLTVKTNGVQQYAASNGCTSPSLPTPSKSNYTRMSNGAGHMEDDSFKYASKISHMIQEIVRMSVEWGRENHRESAKTGSNSLNAENEELKRELLMRDQQFDEMLYENDQLKTKLEKVPFK